MFVRKLFFNLLLFGKLKMLIKIIKVCVLYIIYSVNVQYTKYNSQYLNIQIYFLLNESYKDYNNYFA